MENPDISQQFMPHYHDLSFELPDNLRNMILPTGNKAILITMREGVIGEQESCWDIPGTEFKEVED